MHGRSRCSVPKCSSQGRPVCTKEVIRQPNRKAYISSDMLCDLAESVLKSNIFKFGKILKQKRRTAIGAKFPPPYSILCMAEL